MKKILLSMLATIGVCILCMYPGMIILDVYGTNGITVLPLFWGGMLYEQFIRYQARSL